MTIGSRSSRGCPWMMAHWIASRSSATSARRRVRSAWVAQSSSSLADASSSACGGWWARRVEDMPDSIEHMFDRQRLWAPVWGATCRASHKRNVPWWCLVWTISVLDRVAPQHGERSPAAHTKRTVRHMPRLPVATWLLPAIATLLVGPACSRRAPLSFSDPRGDAPVRFDLHSDHNHQRTRTRCGQAAGTGPAGKRFADLWLQRCRRQRGPRGPNDPSWQRCCDRASHR